MLTRHILTCRQKLALNQYLTHLDNPQVAFSVKQAKPDTVDDAVMTLEMDSYLQAAKPGRVATVDSGILLPEAEPIAAASLSPRKDPTQLILESKIQEVGTPPRTFAPRSQFRSTLAAGTVETLVIWPGTARSHGREAISQEQ